MMRVVTAVVAIAAGLLVLIGYFVPVEPLGQFRLLLVQWATILAAVAILIGIVNLFGVHWQKIRTRQKNAVYSILLVFALFATFVLGVVGTDNPVLSFVLDTIIVPAEAALMALLAVTLVYASARLLRRRVDIMSFIFLIFAILTLLLVTPMPFGKIPGADFVRGIIVNFFALAGARGILIGVALGALTTGLRVLFGIDRPYGGN
jgi:nitrate reductase NapE component